MKNTCISSLKQLDARLKVKGNHDTDYLANFVDKYVAIRVQNGKSYFGYLKEFSYDKKSHCLFLNIEQPDAGSKIIRLDRGTKYSIHLLGKRTAPGLSYATRKQLEQLSQRPEIAELRIKPRKNTHEVLTQLERFYGHEIEILDNASMSGHAERGYISGPEDVTLNDTTGEVFIDLKRPQYSPDTQQMGLYSRPIPSASYYPHGFRIRLVKD